MPRFARGKYSKAICDICGFAYPYQTLKKNSDGFLVCPTDYEPEHPQENPRGIYPDPQALRSPRPEKEIRLTDYGDEVLEDFPWNTHGKKA